MEGDACPPNSKVVLCDQFGHFGWRQKLRCVQNHRIKKSAKRKKSLRKFQHPGLAFLVIRELLSQSAKRHRHEHIQEMQIWGMAPDSGYQLKCSVGQVPGRIHWPGGNFSGHGMARSLNLQLRVSTTSGNGGAAPGHCWHSGSRSPGRVFGGCGKAKF